MPWFFKILFIFNWDRKKIFWTLVQKQTCVCLCFERVALRKWGTQVHMSILPHLRCRFLASLLLIQEIEGFFFFLGTLQRATLHSCPAVQCVCASLYLLADNQPAFLKKSLIRHEMFLQKVLISTKHTFPRLDLIKSVLTDCI